MGVIYEGLEIGTLKFVDGSQLDQQTHFERSLLTCWRRLGDRKTQVQKRCRGGQAGAQEEAFCICR